MSIYIQAKEGDKNIYIYERKGIAVRLLQLGIIRKG